MKILHLPYSFFPKSTGGKEVFVYQLIKNSSSIAQHLVVIHEGDKTEKYTYNGVQVQVLPVATSSNKAITYFNGIYNDLQGFEAVLDEFKPDVVHFHDQGEGASLSHLLACKQKNIKTLLTYHSPGQSCLQRSLMFQGQAPCNGIIDYTKCTFCRNKILGLPDFAAHLLSHVTLPIDKSGKYIKRNSTELFYNAWQQFYNTVDAIQVHARWVKEMLVNNKVPEQKIHFVQMGGHLLASDTTKAPTEPDYFFQAIGSKERPLKLVFVGRCTDIKGVHLLIDAVQQLPTHVHVEVHFFGPYWSDTDYGKRMLDKIKEDHRFQSPVLIEQDKILAALTTMDVCVIPSIWPETGPFTVFDAFAAKLPIIGSNYAGIAERVNDGVDGLLFDWNNSDALADRIVQLCETKGLYKNLKQQIQINRSFKEMAEDFIDLYQNIIDK